MELTLLIIPGLGDSGPEHWQSYWLKKFDNAVKVTQYEWDEPILSDWIQSLDRTIAAQETPVILVAHSLAVSLVLHWSQAHRSTKVLGALLVAPADVDSPLHTPSEVRNFAPMPLQKFPYASTVVASTNDPYVSLERAQFFAKHWGSNFVGVGEQGHLNVASHLGYWEEGQHILETILEAVS